MGITRPVDEAEAIGTIFGLGTVPGAVTPEGKRLGIAFGTVLQHGLVETTEDALGKLGGEHDTIFGILILRIGRIFLGIGWIGNRIIYANFQ